MSAGLIALLTAAVLCVSGCSSASESGQSDASSDQVTEEDAAAADSEEADMEAAENSAADDTSASDAESDENTIYYPDPSIQGNLPDAKPTAAEDFYLYANYDYLKNSEIPADALGLQAAVVLTDKMQNDLEELMAGDSAVNEDLAKISTIYKQYLDTDSRNAIGFDCVKPYVEAIEQAETLEDLYKVMDADINSWDFYGFFTLGSDVDYKDSEKYVIYLTAPHLSLGDAAEYTEMTDEGKSTREDNNTYYTKLLTKYGYSESETAKIIDDYSNWEDKIAPYLYTNDTKYQDDYGEVSYNPMTEEELIEMAGSFPMQELLTNLGIEGQKKYIVDQPEFYKELGKLVTEDNLSEIKSYLILNVLGYSAPYTDEEAYEDNYEWSMGKYGMTEPLTMELQAYICVHSVLPELLGKAYAEEFFDESKEEDVREILNNIRAALRKRMEENTWLSDETKEKAIEKLDAITIYIGSADVDFYDYSRINPDPDKDLFTNIMAVKAECDAQNLERAGTAVNNEAWGYTMPANRVNGAYSPDTNCIYITAAMLQDPYYSVDNTVEQNYGGIGETIGHEFTHAFDKTGSQYDKDGNLKDWMTAEDKAKLADLSSKVAERYGAYAILDDQHVDGQLTLGETVADLGGMACTLDALKALSLDHDINYEEFFTQNAKVYAQLYTEEVESLVILKDVHAPGSLRVNVNLPQFDEFYDTFDVQEGDPMYTAPEDRLKVW